jgi:catechol 2,3-dioxygenase-like lactoylglutathione lyase family enzyme
MDSTRRRTKVHSEPLIAVRDVRASSRWYQQLLGFDSLPEHSHRNFYDRMLCDGQLVLQLHAWDQHDHPNLMNADAAPIGHGVVLWFQVDDFDAVVERARGLRFEILLEPHFNPAPRHREMWLRDPDGYVVAIASPDGESSS